MSEETNGVAVETEVVRVFDSKDDADKTPPPKTEKGKEDRLYHCTLGDKHCWVYEKNPIIALGRAAKHVGHVAVPTGKVVNLEAGRAMAFAMSPADRAKLVAELLAGS